VGATWKKELAASAGIAIWGAGKTFLGGARWLVVMFGGGSATADVRVVRQIGADEWARKK